MRYYQLPRKGLKKSRSSVKGRTRKNCSLVRIKSRCKP